MTSFIILNVSNTSKSSFVSSRFVVYDLVHTMSAGSLEAVTTAIRKTQAWSPQRVALSHNERWALPRTIRLRRGSALNLASMERVRDSLLRRYRKSTWVAFVTFLGVRVWVMCATGVIYVVLADDKETVEEIQSRKKNEWILHWCDEQNQNRAWIER